MSVLESLYIKGQEKYKMWLSSTEITKSMREAGTFPFFVAMITFTLYYKIDLNAGVGWGNDRLRCCVLKS